MRRFKFSARLRKITGIVYLTQTPYGGIGMHRDTARLILYGGLLYHFVVQLQKRWCILPVWPYHFKVTRDTEAQFTNTNDKWYV